MKTSTPGSQGIAYYCVQRPRLARETSNWISHLQAECGRGLTLCPHRSCGVRHSRDCQQSLVFFPQMGPMWVDLQSIGAPPSNPVSMKLKSPAESLNPSVSPTPTVHWLPPVVTHGACRLGLTEPCSPSWPCLPRF